MKEREKDMKVYPNYYSIMPAKVRYSKDLSDFEKILYSEITALSNKLGYCYASNSYFGKLYNKAPQTISKSINKMARLGFIRVEIEKENGNQRLIFIDTPINENVNTPINENANHNTTSKNTTSLPNARARAKDMTFKEYVLDVLKDKL